MTFRLFVTVAGLRARWLLTHRGDFWIGTVVALTVQAGLVYSLWSSLFREAGATTVGGYTLREIIVYLLMVMVAGRVVRGTGRTEGTFAADIYDGSLVHYAVYPTHYFLFKYAERVGEMLPGLVQLALLLPGAAALGGTDTVAAGGGTLLGGLVALVLANALYFILFGPVEGVAFWAEGVWSLVFMSRYVVTLLGGGMMPLGLFPAWAREALYWSPFPYLFDRPVNLLLGRVPVGEWWSGCVVGAAWVAALSLATHLVWHHGGRRYTSAGA